MRARLLAIFWWGIVFLAVYELLITRQVGQVFKTEWCNPPFLENIGIMDVSIIKQCNHMMLSFDNQVYDTVLYGARSRAAIVRVQIPPHSIFDGLIKANEMLKAHPVVPGSSTYRGGERNLKRGVGFQFFRCLELLIRMPVAVSSAFWPSGTVETPIARSH